MRILVVLAALIVLAGCGSSSTARPDTPSDTGKPGPDPSARPDSADDALAAMESASAKGKEPVAKPVDAPKPGDTVKPAAAPEADKPYFEEQWAPAINKVRVELQKYKRW